MDYTSEQRAAIETHDRNVIVIAGAGSGKTRVLVDRFVALLAAHPDWPVASLAAITFTEKAARELRDRLRSAINQRIETAETPEARVFWQRRGSGLDSARIGTIHSLCALIVRANAANLSIDPGFRVLDENDSMLARDVALNEALNQLTALPEARLFLHYTIEAIRGALENALSWKLNSAPPAIDPVVLRVQMAAQALAELRRDRQFRKALDWRPAEAPDPKDKLGLVWSELRVYEADIFSASIDGALRILQWCNVSINLRLGSDKGWHGPDQYKEAKAALGVIKDRASATLTQIGGGEESADQLSAELLPCWYTAVQVAQGIYRDHKKNLRALDFDDLETFARDLLSRESIRARYRGVEFNHVLVDEFQDTNAAQREIVYALTGLDRPGSLFVVGDPKQAIYGFRGADVRIFEQIQQEIIDAGGVQIGLNTSFRAHSGLIGSLNELFSQLDAGVAFAPLFSVRAMEAHHSPTLEIVAFYKDRALQPERGNVPAAKIRTWEAHVLAERLTELVRDQHLIWDRRQHTYRPANFGDCAVLFPVRAGMPSVEEAFKAANIPYVTVSGVGYYDRPEVQDVLNLLQALANPADELALAIALRSPLYGISDDGLYGLRLWHPNQSLWRALTDETAPDQPDASALTFAAESLLALHGWVGRVTIAELIGRSLESTGFLATLTGLPDGVRRVGNVEKLLDVAREAGRITLSDFLTLLHDRSERELREGEVPLDTGGAVQLMTIHAAKGLEFPVVALFQADSMGSNWSAVLRYDPDLGLAAKMPRNQEDDPRSADKWDKPLIYRLVEQQAARREQAERIRLLYVALTRAADKLIVLGELRVKESPANAGATSIDWMECLVEAFHLPRIPGESVTHFERSWGTIRCLAPQQEAHSSVPSMSISTGPNNPLANISRSISVYRPPLLAPIPLLSNAPTRTLTATMVADLGEAHAVKPSLAPDAALDRFARFRRQVLHGAPSSIPDILPSSGGAADEGRRDRQFRRIVGEIVHRALQFGLIADSDRGTAGTAERLALYARQFGLTEKAEVENVVKDALALLIQSEHSAALQPLRELSPDRIHRELPFSLQLGERTINGQIDALYLDPSGLWTVLDYKTDEVRPELIPYHSRRYWGQVGLYALAVEAVTGQIPRVQLYYIRAALNITIREVDWRGAIDRLDADLQMALQ